MGARARRAGAAPGFGEVAGHGRWVVVLARTTLVAGQGRSGNLMNCERWARSGARLPPQLITDRSEAGRDG